MTKFWLAVENFSRQKILAAKIFRDKVIVFLKSVVTPAKNTHCYEYAKALKGFPEKYFLWILLIWLSVKLHSLEILKVIERRMLYSKLS